MIPIFEDVDYAVVLFSGGVDSTTLLHKYIDKYDSGRVHALSVIYGSKHNMIEDEYAQLIADKLGVIRKVINVNFNDWGFESNLLKSGGEIPKGHYADESMKSTVVPFRNGILLSIATGYAESINANIVAYGPHAGDHPVYPDCRPEFISAMKESILQGTDGKIRLDTPFSNITKTDIVKLGHEKYNIDYKGTWSCYEPVSIPTGTIHCGQCGTCVERKESFQDSNINDPTEYEK